MSRIAQQMSETKQLLRRFQAFLSLLNDNQQVIAKELRAMGDRENSIYVRRNLRILAATNASMRRFALLSLDEEETVETPPVSQLVKDTTGDSIAPEAPQEEGVDLDG